MARPREEKLEPAPYDPVASLEGVQNVYARQLPVSRLEYLWTIVGCAVVVWIGFAANTPGTRDRFDEWSLGFITFKLGHAASIVTYGLVGVVFLVGLGYVLFTIVLTPELWPPFSRGEEQLRQRYGAWLPPVARLVNTALVLVCVAGLVGVFAEVYLELGWRTRCFSPRVHHHVDALYIAVTNFTLVGSGSFTPRSGACRLIVAGESVVALAVIAVGIAVLATRLGAQHQPSSVMPERTRRPPSAP